MPKPLLNNIVKIHYTGRLTDGTEFDSSHGREPLEFTIGARQVITGFENAVLDLELGQSTTVTIPAADAYGPQREGETNHPLAGKDLVFDIKLVEII